MPRTTPAHVRVVEYEVPDREGDGKGDVIALVTTITETTAAPAGLLETGNKQLKTYLCGPGKVRSKSPDMVRQDIYGYLLTHYAISCPDLQSSHRNQTYPRVVKRARHNSYRVKRPGDHGTRHSGPATISLVNSRRLTLAA